MTSTMGSIREFFTLRDALREQAQLGEPARERIARELSLGRQRIEGAEALWSGGHAAEGLRLAASGLDATCDALASHPLAAGTDDEALMQALRVRGIRADRCESVRAVRADIAKTPLPELDGDIARAHEELFDRIVRASRTIDGALGVATQTRPQLLRRRVMRIAATCVGVVVFGLVTAKMLAPDRSTRISASATWEDAAVFVPEKLFDGDPTTRWLLPDRSAGWVEVHYGTPRRIDTVRVTNTNNPPWGDRATKEYRVEVYRAGHLERSVEGEFAEGDLSPQSHAFGIDGIDRLRIQIRSWHKTGAGLAEVVVE